MAISLSLGVIGTLIFGLGLTFFLEWVELFILGILCAIVGLIIVILAYPLHKKISLILKTKYKDEIINLSNELLNK
jgi:MFS family permease